MQKKQVSKVSLSPGQEGQLFNELVAQLDSGSIFRPVKTGSPVSTENPEVKA